MNFKKSFIVGVAALVFSAASLAATVEIAGVKVQESATVNGVKLQLNGAGVRTKIFRIYVAELFTTQKISSLQELLAAPGPKRFSLTMIRDIDSGAFGKLLTRGVEDNVPKNQMSKLIPGLIKMSELFTENKTMKAGDVIIMDWIPGTGMVVTVKGQVKGEPFKEAEFFAGMMSIWFGASPADWKLKDALLGIK